MVCFHEGVGVFLDLLLVRLFKGAAGAECAIGMRCRLALLQRGEGSGLGAFSFLFGQGVFILFSHHSMQTSLTCGFSISKALGTTRVKWIQH